MRFLIAIALLLLATPTLRAEELPTTDLEVRPAVVQPAVTAEAPSQPQMILEEVRIPEQRTATSPAMVEQDMPRRGSFWWLVGVIVVAGLILAVVLD